MNIRFDKKQLITLIILAILFGSVALTNLGSSDFPLDPNIQKVRLGIIFIALLLFTWISDFDIWGFPRKNLPLIVVWLLLGFTSLISGIVNDDLISIKDGLWQVIVIPKVFFYLLPKLMNKHANLLLAISLSLGLIPYICISLWIQPISVYSAYSGIFPNANQLGFISTSIASGLFIILIGNLSKQKKLWYSVPIILLLIILFFLILLSSSRTSLIAFLVMLLVLIWWLTQKPRILIKMIAIIAIVFSTIFFSGYKQLDILWYALEQLDKKEGLSGREDIWSKTFEDMRLLGNGSDYFESNFGFGGHNSIITVLGINGVIAALLMSVLAIFSLFYAYFYFKAAFKKDDYAIAPLIITICFWVLSMGEGMFGSLGTAMTIAYVLSLGIIMA
jgi:O-antigen ligase